MRSSSAASRSSSSRAISRSANGSPRRSASGSPRQSASASRRRADRSPGSSRARACGDQRLEPGQVDLVRRDLQQIAGRARPDPIGAEQLAQAGDVPVQRGLRGARRLLAPQRLDQLGARHHLRRGAGAAARAAPAAWGAPGSHRSHPRRPAADQAARTRTCADCSHALARALAARQRRVSAAARSSPPRRPERSPVEHRHDKPQSFHASPAEALQAPPEEFLYLACLHEGTGVDKPDFLAVVDAEDGRIVHETPMPNVGDELHHFGWNRCSSACHGPDRSHLIVPGFRSSRIHVVNVADDPRRPRIEKVIERDELVRATGPDAPAHRALHARREHRHQHARRRRRQRRLRLRRARRAHVRGQGPLGERRADTRRSTTTSGTSRARTCSPRRSSASPTPTRPGSTSTTSPPGATAAACTSGT